MATKTVIGTPFEADFRPSAQFRSLDCCVTERLVRLLPPTRAFGPGARRRLFLHGKRPHLRFVRDFELHQLLGTIRYP